MTLALYAHPFSSYCQKALIALYEKDLPFEFRQVDGQHEENSAAWSQLWPLKRFPLLVDGDLTLPEASIIIEHLDLAFPETPRMLPADAGEALPVRLLDRIFDNYVMTPMQRIVFDRIREESDRDAKGVAEQHALLDTSYDWLERKVGDGWIAGEFSLADCAAAPSLFYADWVHPIGEAWPRLAAYRARLLARPSVARAVDEARPYRSFFPGGAPDRD